MVELSRDKTNFEIISKTHDMEQMFIICLTGEQLSILLGVIKALIKFYIEKNKPHIVL
jgi:hypothetical protein